MKFILSALIAGALFFSSTEIQAEEPTPPADTPEAREAAEEDAAEQKLSEVDQIAAIKNVKGRITLGDGGTGNAEIVGQVTAESGESYFLKLANKNLLKKLQTYDGKSAVLVGKLRNKDKYLVIQSIADVGGGASARTKRGGI